MTETNDTPNLEESSNGDLPSHEEIHEKPFINNEPAPLVQSPLYPKSEEAYYNINNDDKNQDNNETPILGQIRTRVKHQKKIIFLIICIFIIIIVDIIFQIIFGFNPCILIDSFAIFIMAIIYLIFIYKGISLNNLKLAYATLTVIALGFGCRLVGSSLFEIEVMKIINYTILAIRSLVIFYCFYFMVKS